MDCKYCDIEEKWKHDETNDPSQEVLGDFDLEAWNAVKTQALLNAVRKSTKKALIYQREAKVTQESPKVPECVQSHQQDDKQTHKLHSKRPSKVNTSQYQPQPPGGGKGPENNNKNSSKKKLIMSDLLLKEDIPMSLPVKLDHAQHWCHDKEHEYWVQQDILRNGDTPSVFGRVK